jgi:hypothetical protein
MAFTPKGSCYGIPSAETREYRRKRSPLPKKSKNGTDTTNFADFWAPGKQIPEAVENPWNQGNPRRF